MQILIERIQTDVWANHALFKKKRKKPVDETRISLRILVLFETKRSKESEVKQQKLLSGS